MTRMVPPPEHLEERAKVRNEPLSDERLKEIIAADDEYYRPMFTSGEASKMAAELLNLRAEIRAGKDGAK